MAKPRVATVQPAFTPAHPLIAYLGKGYRPYSVPPTLIAGGPGTGKSQLVLALIRDYLNYGDAFSEVFGGNSSPPERIILAYSEQAILAYIPTFFAGVPTERFYIAPVGSWADLVALVAHAEERTIIFCDSITILETITVAAPNLDSVKTVSTIQNGTATGYGVSELRVAWQKASFATPSSPMAGRAAMEALSVPLLNQAALRGIGIFLVSQVRMAVGAFAYQKPAAGNAAMHLCNPVLMMSKTDKDNLFGVAVKKATGELYQGGVNPIEPIASLATWLNLDAEGRDGRELAREVCIAVRARWGGGK